MINVGCFSTNKIFIYVALVLFGCNTFNKKIPLGSISDSNKKFELSTIYYESNNYKKGLQIIDSIFKKINNPTLHDYDTYFKAYADDAAWDKQFYKQIRYADSLITIIENNSNEKNGGHIFIDAYLRKASGNYELQNTELGNEYYFKAFNIAEKYGLIDYKSQLSYDIAMKMYQQKKFDTAAKYFKLSYQYNLLNINIPIPYRNNKTQELLDNIGLCYTNIQNIDSAIAYYTNCIYFLHNPKHVLATDSVNSNIRKRCALGVVHGNLAKVFVLQNKIDTAIALYNKAINYNNFLEGDTYDMQTCIIQLANIYIDQKNKLALQKLITQFKKSLQKNNYLKGRVEAERMQYNLFLLDKQPLKALEKLQAYNVVRDSVTINEANANKQDITKELKDREQQLQISLLSKENQLSKIYTWAFAIFSLLVLSGIFLVYRFYKKEKKNVQLQAQLNQAITEQKKEIELVADELSKANTQKEKLMNIMAHELRSPISGVVAVANTLTQSDDISGQSLALVQMIEQTSTNTLTLINSLLNEKDKTTMELNKATTNLSQLINKTVSLLQYKAAEKSQQIVVQHSHNEALLNIDADKIERVLINLITNAIKFSNNHQTITITSQWQESIVKIMVADKGVGMNETQLHNLFSEHVTIKRAGTMGEKSFGLGLAICKQIIESHNGNLWVESKENKGSTFTVQLPT